MISFFVKFEKPLSIWMHKKHAFHYLGGVPADMVYIPISLLVELEIINPSQPLDSINDSDIIEAVRNLPADIILKAVRGSVLSGQISIKKAAPEGDGCDCRSICVCP